PIVGVSLVPPSSDRTRPPPASAHPINGHEWDTSGAGDLQYACTFKLEQSRSCAGVLTNCDCPNGTENQNPLCQDQATGAPSTTQYGAKAYPGTRHLQVAKGLGDQAIVASICPANTKDATAADYGYRPAVEALVERLKTKLKGQCLPRALQ